MGSTQKASRQRKELPVGVFGDRRRAARKAVAVPCQAVTDDDFCLLSDEIADLSTTGMLLRADGIPADVGESVLVSFRPPRSDLWIDVQARIVRLLNGREPGAPGYGLELEALSPFEREVLAAALRRSAPTKKRVRAPRRRGRRRYVDPDAVVVRPLLGVSEGAPTESALPPSVPLPVLKAEVPRSTFADEGGVVLVRRGRLKRTPRSLWKDEEARVVVAGQRPKPKPRYVRPRPNRKLQSVEAPPAREVIVARPEPEPRRITATGDLRAPVLEEPHSLPAPAVAVSVQPAIEVQGAPPSVVVVRTLPAGTPAPPPPDAAPSRVVVVGRTSPETCVSDWSCST